MTKSQLRAVVAAIVTLREGADDELALEAVELYPEWKPDAEYVKGARVKYGGTLYTVLQTHKAQDDWKPDVASSLFSRVLIPDPEVVPEWEQPDSTNPYKAGDRVTHNGKVWVCVVDNCVWEPGVYGWEVSVV